MVTVLTGDIFSANTQVITNPINCKGVMGKGLAAQFKVKFPEMFHDYKVRCSRGEVKIGEPYLWQDNEYEVLNFPTKDNWQNSSKIDYIDSGLQYLVNNYQNMGICTLALPALGCGLGGLELSDVFRLVEKYFKDLQDIEVFLYVPSQADLRSLSDEGFNQSSQNEVEGLAASL